MLFFYGLYLGLLIDLDKNITKYLETLFEINKK